MGTLLLKRRLQLALYLLACVAVGASWAVLHGIPGIGSMMMVRKEDLEWFCFWAPDGYCMVALNRGKWAVRVGCIHPDIVESSGIIGWGVVKYFISVLEAQMPPEEWWDDAWWDSD